MIAQILSHLGPIDDRALVSVNAWMGYCRAKKGGLFDLYPGAQGREGQAQVQAEQAAPGGGQAGRPGKVGGEPPEASGFGQTAQDGRTDDSRKAVDPTGASRSASVPP